MFEWPKDSPEWLVLVVTEVEENINLYLSDDATDPIKLARGAGGLKVLRAIKEAADLARIEEEEQRKEVVRKFAEGR